MGAEKLASVFQDQVFINLLDCEYFLYWKLTQISYHRLGR